MTIRAAFADRADAGRQLAGALTHLVGQDLVVLGLPRGGVLVAYEVARVLAAPLDVLVVRKLGAPGNPELAMGAIGEDGVCVLDAEVIDRKGVRAEQVSAVAEREQAVLQARAVRLRRDRGRCELQGRTAVIVDDGMATGCTARAACRSARRRGAKRVVLAVPVAPAETVRTFADADEVVCVLAPERFGAVSAYYRDFGQTHEDEVVALLQRATTPPPLRR